MALKSQVQIDELVVSQSSARRAHVDFYKRGNDLFGQRSKEV